MIPLGLVAVAAVYPFIVFTAMYGILRAARRGRDQRKGRRDFQRLIDEDQAIEDQAIALTRPLPVTSPAGRRTAPTYPRGRERPNPAPGSAHPTLNAARRRNHFTEWARELGW